jgi:hypothetical protein
MKFKLFTIRFKDTEEALYVTGIMNESDNISFSVLKEFFTEDDILNLNNWTHDEHYMKYEGAANKAVTCELNELKVTVIENWYVTHIDGDFIKADKIIEEE